MQEFSPNKFEDVFSAELEEIAKRQDKSNGSEVDRKELAGLALSGGGIRSATSSLGVLQALKSLGLLGAFDYLSTVSGGGFTGAWWSAWTSRIFDTEATKDEKFFPPCERIQPERDASSVTGIPAQTVENGELPLKDDDTKARRNASDPVHHLRLFSNYLTPMKGMFSADTWRANAIVSRNLALTWLVLLPMLFAAVLLAQSYFTFQPNSETEYLYPYSHFAEDNARAREIEFEMRVTKRLDSMVHGGNGVMGLAPVRELKKLGEEPENDFRPEPANRVFAQIIKDIDTLRGVDSSVAQDVGDKKSFQPLQAELDSIALNVGRWQQADLAIRADTSRFKEKPEMRSASPMMRSASPMMRTRSRHEALDSAHTYFSRLLDPDVDTVRLRLARLQDEFISHRVTMRDAMLFNNDHINYLAHRVLWTSRIPIMLLSWIVMLIVLWMINSGHRPYGGNVLQGSYAYLSGLVTFIVLSWALPEIMGVVEWQIGSLTDILIYQLGWSLVALVLINLIIWDDAYWFWKKHRKPMRNMDESSDLSRQLAKLIEVRLSKIVTYHQRLLLVAFFITILLCFGGFGHEAINYLFFYNSGHSLDTGQWIARLAGIAAIITALTGTGFAARSATTPGDRGNPKPPSKIKRLLMSITPPIIVLLLLCGISWLSHWVLQELVFMQEQRTNPNVIGLIFAMWLLGFLTLYYAVYDLRFRTKRQFTPLVLTVVLAAQFGVLLAGVFYPSHGFRFEIVWIALPIVVWFVVSMKYRLEQNKRKAGESASLSASEVAGNFKGSSRLWRYTRASVTTLLILICTLLMIVLVGGFVEGAELPLDHLILVALGASLLVLLIELIWGVRSPDYGRRGNNEARILLGINVTFCTLFLIIPPLSVNPHWGVTHVLEILVAMSFGLVIFVGWRVDPNALSIHAFYRNRIVRAYLGASNWLRSFTAVSDVHPNDDVYLVKLSNCEQGAPYHLINTTLNLLGTKSLEAAQRHASNFIMSKRYCGSVTTGYRPTDEYMSGTMTLGSAVAISGAAASPNMGSNQVSGATTMLMSLLNIRLGYWAANPGRSRWREAQPKLWPYYLLKESLSQTTGFGAFCYLTDGGHFDNTGLYPLIERGCRYIVLSDNGTDPHSHFKDLGNSLRRCRIDFGAEFEFDTLKGMTTMGAKDLSGSAHWIRGTVKYSEEHLRILWGENWDEGLSPKDRSDYRIGSILVLKPVILGDEPPDVLQYGLEYADFPQQSTANQWFTEDQFESYRRLGYFSAQIAFASSDYANATRAEMLKDIAEGRSEHRK